MGVLLPLFLGEIMGKELEIYQDIPQIVHDNIKIKDMFGVYFLYMPISLIGNVDRIYPDVNTVNNDVKQLISTCINDFDKNRHGHHKNYNIYLSFETSYVKKGVPQKRPGRGS